MAEMRAQQYGQLANLLLSYIPQYAECYESYSLALALKDLSRHHFIVRECISVIYSLLFDNGIICIMEYLIQYTSIYAKLVVLSDDV